MTLLVALIVLAAYLLGSIPSGLLISKSQGLDIREHGSRNIGATNVWRVMGKKWGLLAFFCDTFKGWLAIIIGVAIAARWGYEIPLARGKVGIDHLAHDYAGIAAGVCDGLGLGDNSKAALVTRSLAELIRLGTALGGQRETFQGLSGIGDLMVTCFSRHSRNHAVGERLGRGERLADIVSSMNMVAEGVPTTYSAHECSRRLGVETPIIDQMRALLDGALTAREVATNLLARDPKAE